jgi:hypothetical protein
MGRDRTVFRPLNSTEKRELEEAGYPDEVLPYVRRLVTKLRQYRGDKTLEGKPAVQRLAALNREINVIVRDAHAHGVAPSIGSAVDAVASKVRGSITKQFSDQGLGEQWKKANNVYIDYSDFVEQSRALLASREGVYTFADKLTRIAGKRGSATDMKDSLIELVGPQGKALVDKIYTLNAAMKFAPKAPQLGVAQGVAMTGAIPLVRSNPILGAASVAATGGLSSPRASLHLARGLKWAGGLDDAAAAKLVPFARALREHVGEIPSADRAALLASPAFAEMAREMVGGTAMEEQAKQQLTDWAAKNLGGAK